MGWILYPQITLSPLRSSSRLRECAGGCRTPRGLFLWLWATVTFLWQHPEQAAGTCTRSCAQNHCLSFSRTHVRVAFVSPFDSLLLCSSQTCRQWHPDPNNALNQYQQRWLRHLSLCRVTVGMTDANNSTDMFDHQVSATAGDTEQSQHPHEGHVASSAVLWYLLTSFLYDLAFPSSMNLLWAWQCGFLRRRLEYKYGLLRLELLFLLWYKGFQETEQIGQVATWAALFASLCFFVGKGVDFTPARRSQTPDVDSTTCTNTRPDEEVKRKTLEDYFPLWNWIFFFCCLFPPSILAHSCEQPVLPLWNHPLSHRLPSPCLRVSITSCRALVLWTRRMWDRWFSPGLLNRAALSE